MVVCLCLLFAGFDQMMEQSRVQDLARMFALLQRVSKLDKLLAALKAYVSKVR
jgi:hypothetical protein